MTRLADLLRNTAPPRTHAEVAAQLADLVQAEMSGADLDPFEALLEALPAYPDLVARYERLLADAEMAELDALAGLAVPPAPTLFPAPAAPHAGVRGYGPLRDRVLVHLRLPTRAAAPVPVFSQSHMVFNDLVREPALIGHLIVELRSADDHQVVQATFQPIQGRWTLAVQLGTKPLPLLDQRGDVWRWGPLPPDADALTVLIHPAA